MAYQELVVWVVEACRDIKIAFMFFLPVYILPLIEFFQIPNSPTGFAKQRGMPILSSQGFDEME